MGVDNKTQRNTQQKYRESHLIFPPTPYFLLHRKIHTKKTHKRPTENPFHPYYLTLPISFSPSFFFSFWKSTYPTTTHLHGFSFIIQLHNHHIKPLLQQSTYHLGNRYHTSGAKALPPPITTCHRCQQAKSFTCRATHLLFLKFLGQIWLNPRS